MKRSGTIATSGNKELGSCEIVVKRIVHVCDLLQQASLMIEEIQSLGVHAPTAVNLIQRTGMEVREGAKDIISGGQRSNEKAAYTGAS